MKLNVSLLALAAGLVLGTTPDATATTISVSDIQACGFGQTTCAVPGATVTSTNGSISWKELNGYTGVGVGGGVVDSEIDSNEVLDITFDSASTVDSVELVFLYQPPTYGDQSFNVDGDEVALIEGFNGLVSVGIVRVNVTGLTSAVTTAGSITNLSIANETGGGAWTLSNPFGSEQVTRLSFTSGYPGPTSAYSDFAIGATSFQSSTPVPEPATLLLFGSGAAVLVRRRRR